MKLSQLSNEQRSHLVWRLDAKTGMGLLTAVRMARGDYGDLELVDMFLKADRTLKSAQAHARLVEKYNRY